jgi:SAM-dependent methyltransferase
MLTFSWVIVLSLTQTLASNWLRRIALPIRTGHPQLYGALKRVRTRLIVGRRDLDAYQFLAVEQFRRHWLPRRTGVRILEVGSDARRAVLRALAGLGVEAVGINPAEDEGGAPAGSPRQLPGGATFLRADARALPFADESFDAIFSVATFEHIHDLPLALTEMYRVLAPGGVVYSAFGPIWSGGKGHHLRVEVDGIEARHFKPETNPLPDFSHLLLEPEQMRAALQRRVDPRLCEPIVAWVYEDPAINRLCFCDYLEAFQRSPFELRALRTEDDPVAAPLRRVLAFRHPRESRFEVTNVEVVLCKGKTTGGVDP